MSDEFVVNDKRLFSKDGQVNEAAGRDERPKADAGPAPERGDGSGRMENLAGGGDLPPANFASLLIGLATSAFMHLGENPMGEGEGGPPDLVAAKHAIDLLAVLQEKTRGNLEAEETALMNTLLYDLRMKFVAATGGK